jgi:serine/threonine protein kinase
MPVDESNDDRTQSFIALTKGIEVSHYRIVEKIGAGGMGEVYLAEDTELHRRVALKFLPPHLCQDDDCRKRFKREAQAAAGLDHPNIAAIHEVGDFQGRPFYAMQIVEGQSLKDVIAGKELPIDRILEICIQVCEGLQAAHDKGIIHRDIKPSNILLDSHGRVRIVDFGLAAIRGAEHLTKTGSTLGTIGYMSPEQVQGEEIDQRSDLFSLGVVLYELVTRQDPFKRDSEAATLKAVINDLPEPLARFKSGLPEGLQGIVEKALDKDVKTRYQHADGMQSDMMRLKRLIDSGESKVLVSLPPTTSWRLKWMVPVVVLAALAVLVGFWTTRENEEPVVPTSRQITYVGDAQLCEMSPDGQFYAFSREMEDQVCLYVADLAGGDPLQILEADGIVGFDWSPDGTELSVSYKRDSVYGTFLIPRLGGGSKKLLRGLCTDFQVAWSPIGKQMVAHNTCESFGTVILLQPDQGIRTTNPVSIKGEWSENLEWSPSGDKLLMTSNHSTYNALWSITLDDFKTTELMSGDFRDAHWAADGKSIYYRPYVPMGVGKLMKIEYDDNSGHLIGDPRTILSNFDALSVSISRDNKRMLYCQRDLHSNLWYTPVRDSKTGDSRQITFGTAYAAWPAFSPDGKSIAYSLWKEDRADVYRLPLDGGPVQRLTFEGLYNLGQTWSPDGQEIAYLHSPDGTRFVIKTMDLRSGQARTIDSSKYAWDAVYTGLNWGVDNNIYVQKPGNRNIIALNAESGDRRELIRHDSVGWAFDARVSPDGETVAVFWNNQDRGRGVYILSLDDTTQSCIWQRESNESLISPIRWSKDGEWLYGSDGKYMYRLHRTGTTRDTIGPLPYATKSYLYGFVPDLSPVTDAMISTEISASTDVFLMENFDPEVD